MRLFALTVETASKHSRCANFEFRPLCWLSWNYPNKRETGELASLPRTSASKTNFARGALCILLVHLGLEIKCRLYFSGSRLYYIINHEILDSTPWRVISFLCLCYLEFHWKDRGINGRPTNDLCLTRLARLYFFWMSVRMRGHDLQQIGQTDIEFVITVCLWEFGLLASKVRLLSWPASQRYPPHLGWIRCSHCVIDSTLPSCFLLTFYQSLTQLCADGLYYRHRDYSSR